MASKFPLVLLATLCLLCSCNENGNNTFTDSRDGKKYKTVKIGEQIWMAENLNYGAKNENCYDNDSTLCKQCGRLYAWFQATKICPDGWHLPDNAEWDDLIEAMAKDGSLKDSFALLHCGYEIYDCFIFFEGFGELASFWSGTDVEDCDAQVYLGPGSCLAYIWNLDGWTYHAKSNGHSVRCVKDI
jgi:uncharacterized protein (TIGR02145 family)